MNASIRSSVWQQAVLALALGIGCGVVHAQAVIQVAKHPPLETPAVVQLAPTPVTTGAVPTPPGHEERSAEPTVTWTEQDREIMLGSAKPMGYATDQLFAMQRHAPASRPRPIDGDQASRSYHRYLKSFEREIPEKFDAGGFKSK